MLYGQPEYISRAINAELGAFFDETARFMLLSARVANDPAEPNVAALRSSLERLTGATNALNAAAKSDASQ